MFVLDCPKTAHFVILYPIALLIKTISEISITARNSIFTHQVVYYLSQSKSISGPLDQKFCFVHCYRMGPENIKYNVGTQ